MKRFITLTLALVLLVGLSPLFAQEGGHGGGGGEAGGEGNKKPLPPPAIPAPDNISTYLHLQVNNITKASPPRIQDRKLILTWKGDTMPRYVAAAFGHESFREKHVFWRNQNGVYFLVLDITSAMPAQLEYRLIVDGLWQADSSNPNQFRNEQGVTLSRVSLSSSDFPMHAGPSQGNFGVVQFSYRGKPGQQISIIGNFNQWDPFSHFLSEDHPGEYHLSLALPVGTLIYRFVSGSKSFLDPGNAHTGHDENGGTFSFFENKMLAPPTVMDAKMAVAAVQH